jgi:hypothetical protein
MTCEAYVDWVVLTIEISYEDHGHVFPERVDESVVGVDHPVRIMP